MIKNIKLSLFIAIFISFILPNLAFASWWNPFSWSLFKKSTEITQTVIATTTSENKIVHIATTTVAIVSNKENKKELSLPGVKASSPKTSVPFKKAIVAKKDSKPVPDPVIVSPKPTDPRTALIAQFMKNPTVENFKVFCVTAKNVQGNLTKQVMDTSRENMITVKKSLYEEMIDCQNINSTDSYKYYLPLDSALLFPLQDSDTDEIREAKIIYNDKIKSLMVKSKVKFVRFGGSDTIHSPLEQFNFYVDNIKRLRVEIKKLNETKDKSNGILTNLELNNTSLEIILHSLKEIKVTDLSDNFK